MTRRAAVALVACAALWCGADASASGWYAVPMLSLGEAHIDDSDHAGTIGTGARFGGRTDGHIDHPAVVDYAAGLGAAIGWRGSHGWAFEGELAWRYRTDWDLRAATPAIGAITNVFTDVQTTTVLLSVLRTRALTRRWSAEAGVGVGWVHNRLEGDYIERGSAARGRAERVLHHTSGNTRRTWHALLGVSRRRANGGVLSLRYRYVPLGRLRVGPFVDNGAFVTARHAAHELQIGVTLELGGSR